MHMMLKLPAPNINSLTARPWENVLQRPPGFRFLGITSRQGYYMVSELASTIDSSCPLPAGTCYLLWITWWLLRDLWVGPLPPHLLPKAQISPFGVIPKSSQPGKWWLAVYLQPKSTVMSIMVSRLPDLYHYQTVQVNNFVERDLRQEK